jgi:branched-chain amino acid transport system substrate-binding protein
VPAPTMQFPGVLEFLTRYQAKAAGEGVDPLGYFLPPWAYARMQLMNQAVEGTQSIDDGKLAGYFQTHTFNTIIGDVSFGKDGEWAAPRVVWTQFQHIKSNDLDQFKDPSTEVIVMPQELKSGTLIWPYGSAR